MAVRILFVCFFAPVFLLTILLAATEEAFASKRVALVIGNSNYENIQSLGNPENDARLMAETLGAAGFDVRQVIDADYREMKKELLEFGRTLREQPVEASLIYYAGHGVQVRGENYLIPVNALLSDEDEVDLEGINVNDFLRVMNSSNSPVNIVVLDACRNNPFKGAFRSATRGLAPVDAPMGTLIAYATSPGQVALDGASTNSPYTEALTTAIASGVGQPIESVFKQARRDVLRSTNDKQVPWEVSSITGDFYFYSDSGLETDASGNSSSSSNMDTAYWTAIRENPTTEELRAYIDKFPEGLFAPIARTRLESLENKPQLQASLSPSNVVNGTGAETSIQPVPSDPKELTRAVQEELNRLGCDAGTPDGVWGPKSTRALSTLREKANAQFAALGPNADVLQKLRGYDGRVCPLTCSARFELKNDECVLKTCPAGQLLSSKGTCYAKSQASTQKPASNSNCFMFNGKRYCD